MKTHYIQWHGLYFAGTITERSDNTIDVEFIWTYERRRATFMYCPDAWNFWRRLLDIRKYKDAQIKRIPYV